MGIKDFNVKEIIEAWLISHHPTEQQKKLAEERAAVCVGCEHRKKTFFHYCEMCGCPIDKKIFTNVYNPCPLGKWTEVDDASYMKKKDKTTLL